jgi:broad specificity phosphatase PhoE
LLALPHDCVICTHYIAINVAVGTAQQRDEVLCFRPDHASVTVLDSDRGRLQLVELGREAVTEVLTR